MFLSDNGGCPYHKTRTPDIRPGPAASFHNYDEPWANASNTPFRRYKRHAHEGGIATPMIVRWPEMIEGRGGVTHQVGHIIDIMATCLDVAGAEYPSEFNGHPVLPLEGKSLLPILKGKQREPHEALFWEYRRHSAVRQGKWKLVAERGKDWELYNMELDRTETDDLADEKRVLRNRLVKRYEAWADRVGARHPMQ